MLLKYPLVLGLAFGAGLVEHQALAENVRKLQTASNPSYEILNTILGDLRIDFETEGIDDVESRAEISAFLGSVKVIVKVGGEDKAPGFCDSFSFDGDLTMNGRFPDRNNEGRYLVPFAIDGIGFRCEIPLKVELDDYGGIPLNFLGATSGDGILTVETRTVSFAQELELIGDDFAKAPPNSFSVGSCDIGIDDLDVDADEVLDIFVISLNPQVEGAIEDNPEMVLDPVRDIACELIEDLVAQLGELMISNPLTADGEVFIDNPFDLDNDGEIAALAVESLLVANFTADNEDVMNLRKSNFLLDILFPVGGEEDDNIVAGLFESFNINGVDVDADDLVRFLIEILNLRFDLDIEAPLTDWDLLFVLKDTFNITLFPDTGDLEASDMKLIEDSFETDFGNFAIDIRINELLLSQGDPPETPRNFLNGMQVLGNYSVLLPQLPLGSFTLKLGMSLDISGQNNATDGDIIPSFDFAIPLQQLSADLAMTELIAGVSGFLAIDEVDLYDLQLGPIFNDTLECITSALAAPVFMTGISASQTELTGEVSGATDMVAVIAQEAINSLIVAYQVFGPRLIETVLAANLLDPPIEVIEQGECYELELDETNDVTGYDFSDGIMDTIVDVLDADIIEEVISFIVSAIDDNPELPLVLIDEEDEIDFSFNLLQIDGWSQRLDFLLKSVNIGGLNDLIVNSGGVSVPTDSPRYPQGIQLALDVGTPESKITLSIELDFNISAPEPDEDVVADGGFISDNPPQNLVDAVANNIIRLDLIVGNIEALVEVYAKLSEFDVDGTTIEEALEIPCWISKLEAYGGWTSVFQAFLKEAEASMTCDCNTSVFRDLEVSINDPEGWEDLTDFAQELVDSYISSFVNNYSPEDFQFTIDSATSQCNGGPALSDPITVIPEEASNYGDIAGITVVLVMALGFWVPCFLWRKVRADPNRLERKASISKEMYREKPNLAVLTASKVPLYKNPVMPKPVRIFVGSMLLFNLVCFIYGDLGVAIEIGISGNLFGAPLESGGFATFSVITSTIELFNSGAIYLAVLLLVLAILWPYLKLFSLIFCFYGSTSCIGLEKRRKVLHFLDQFGKWSTVEIFFIIFLRVVFELRVATPNVTFLPEDDLYRLALILAPQLSLYTFVFAVIMSIFLSNILVWYDSQNQLNTEVDLVKEIEDKKNPNTYIKMAILEYEYRVKKADPMDNYSWKISERGRQVMIGMLLFCHIFVWVTCAVAVVEVKYIGLARVLMELEGTSTTFEFSIFNVIEQSWDKALDDGSAGDLFLIIIFTVCLVIMPFLVTIALTNIIFGRFSLRKAREMKIILSIVVAWSAVEVFIVAVIFSVVEIPILADYLAGDACDFLTEFMRDTLLPLGLVTDDDVRSTCFGTEVGIVTGSFVVTIGLLIRFIFFYAVDSMFTQFIAQRKEERIIDSSKEDSLAKAVAEGNIRPVRYNLMMKLLRKLNLVKSYRTNFQGSL